MGRILDEKKRFEILSEEVKMSGIVTFRQDFRDF